MSASEETSTSDFPLRRPSAVRPSTRAKSLHRSLIDTVETRAALAGACCDTPQPELAPAM